MTGSYADIWDYEAMCKSHHAWYDWSRKPA
jgi:hypothetical protein